MARPKKSVSQFIAYEGPDKLPKGEYEEKVDKRGNKYMSVKSEPEARHYLVRKDGGKYELIAIRRKFNGTHRRLVRVLRPKNNQDMALLRVLQDSNKLPIRER